MEGKTNHRDNGNMENVDDDGYGWGKCNVMESHDRMLGRAHTEGGKVREMQGGGRD